MASDPTPEERAERIGQCLVHLVPSVAFVADEIRAAESAARKKALEEAARVCDLRSMSARVGNRPHASEDLRLAAEAIRKLGEEASRG